MRLYDEKKKHKNTHKTHSPRSTNFQPSEKTKREREREKKEMDEAKRKGTKAGETKRARRRRSDFGKES